MRKYLMVAVTVVLTLIVVVGLSVCGLYLRARIDAQKEFAVLMNKVVLHAVDYACLINEKDQLNTARDHAAAIDKIRREVYTDKRFSVGQRQKIDELISDLRKRHKGIAWFFTRWDIG
ncbi:hypothetical protein ATZ36_17135 [Candidatus Endomicrobiellum trichonymphae]|uniref:Uncharacterized protein n=1 Tax=Endomicrobium trichonymphae TaxID=1408204 RepID=A0A1E5IJM5_ENDTX|nr:hypothetical protein ATZ36_17135 [Candidatus Endomicrobium trichonymphae]